MMKIVFCSLVYFFLILIETSLFAGLGHFYPYIPPVSFLFVVILFNSEIISIRGIVVLITLAGIVQDVAHNYIFGLSGGITLISLVCGSIIIKALRNEDRVQKVLIFVLSIGIYLGIRFLTSKIRGI